jgi:hypothetical protein
MNPYSTLTGTTACPTTAPSTGIADTSAPSLESINSTMHTPSPSTGPTAGLTSTAQLIVSEAPIATTSGKGAPPTKPVLPDDIQHMIDLIVDCPVDYRTTSVCRAISSLNNSPDGSGQMSTVYEGKPATIRSEADPFEAVTRFNDLMGDYPIGSPGFKLLTLHLLWARYSQYRETISMDFLRENIGVISRDELGVFQPCIITAFWGFPRPNQSQERYEYMKARLHLNRDLENPDGELMERLMEMMDHRMANPDPDDLPGAL